MISGRLEAVTDSCLCVVGTVCGGCCVVVVGATDGSDEHQRE